MFCAVMAAILIVLLTSTAPALTLEEAVATGLRNNSEMQALKLEEGVVKGQMVKAKLPPLSNPVIEGSFSTHNRPSGEPGGAFRNNQVSLSQSVEVAGQRGLRVDAAASDLERTRLEIRDLERRLEADIRDRFAEALFLRDKEALARENLRIQEELADLVAVKYQAGEVAALEVNLSQVELARAQRDVITGSREYRNGLLSLRTLIGAPPDSTVAVDGELAAGLPPLPDRDALMNRAAERPDVKAKGAAIKRSEAAERLARREAVPNVTWSIFHGRTDGGNETGAALGITVPLFDRKQGELIEAKARLSQARIREAGVTRMAQKEIEEAYASATSSLRELNLFRQAILERATENLDLLRFAFKEGKISFYDVRVAQREMIETRNVYLQTLLTAQRAYNVLEGAIGGELR